MFHQGAHRSGGGGRGDQDRGCERARTELTGSGEWRARELGRGDVQGWAVRMAAAAALRRLGGVQGTRMLCGGVVGERYFL
jgi:hypothetical protein